MPRFLDQLIGKLPWIQEQRESALRFQEKVAAIAMLPYDVARLKASELLQDSERYTTVPATSPAPSDLPRGLQDLFGLYDRIEGAFTIDRSLVGRSEYFSELLPGFQRVGTDFTGHVEVLVTATGDEVRVVEDPKDVTERYPSIWHLLLAYE